MNYVPALFALLGGFIFFFIILAIGIYVWSAIVTSKALKMCGYANPWMAWIPFAASYALADVTRDENGNARIFDKEIPGMLFNFWWVITWAVGFVPFIGAAVSFVLNGICAGTCYEYIYAKIENKTRQETRAVGILSGFISIIALIKFTIYKKDQVR